MKVRFWMDGRELIQNCVWYIWDSSVFFGGSENNGGFCGCFGFFFFLLNCSRLPPIFFLIGVGYWDDVEWPRRLSHKMTCPWLSRPGSFQGSLILSFQDMKVCSWLKKEVSIASCLISYRFHWIFGVALSNKMSRAFVVFYKKSEDI